MERSHASIAAAAVAVGLLVAGCGGGNQPYTAKGTAPCLTSKGFRKVTTDPAKVGFIAGFADNGGIRATGRDGNVVTIAFAGSEAGAKDTETSFRLHASRRYRGHMQDIMESQRNAVLVWTVTPGQQQLTDALACLHP